LPGKKKRSVIKKAGTATIKSVSSHLNRIKLLLKLLDDSDRE